MSKTDVKSINKFRSLFIILAIVIASISIMWIGDKVGHGLYYIIH
ncbi:MAG: hypothetical protein ABI185_05300 [Ginsengibacter sp.]